MENFLRAGFELRILRKMAKPIIIKRYREVDSSFKKETLQGKVYI